MQEEFNFQLGDVVALSSHPFLKLEKSIDVIIAGEPQHISPLMVVVEIVRDNKNQFDEYSGILQTTKSSSQCKCMWFSTKTQQFEDTWISSKLLKLIKASGHHIASLDEIKEKGVGTKVLFITSEIEYSKKKSTIEESKGGDTQQAIKKRVNSLLIFSSPVLELVGTIKSETKDPVYDSKTGNRKREISRLLIKCKYYNQIADKFSEHLIPVEALEFLEKVSEEEMAHFACKRQIVYSDVDSEGECVKRLLITGGIYYKLGRYFVECHDLISNSYFDKDINDLKDRYVDFANSNTVLSRYVESKDDLSNPLLRYNDIADIERVVSDNKKDIYYRMKYIGRYNGKTTVRFVSNCSILNSSEKISEDTDFTFRYMKGFCHTKKDFRYFRLDRIIEIQKFDLNDLSVANK